MSKTISSLLKDDVTTLSVRVCEEGGSFVEIFFKDETEIKVTQFPLLNREEFESLVSDVNYVMGWDK